MKKLLKVLGVLVLLAGGGLLALYVVLRHPPVPVTTGPAADALAHEVERAVNTEAWAKTRALSWRTREGREHLWDRDRGYARVRFSGNEVLIDLARRNGKAWSKGKEVSETAAQRKLLDTGYKWHINDSFWLNPLVKLFDEGVTRGVGTLDSRRVLEVAYSSGGVTPGDRYQWILDENARPVAWRVWASVLAVKGMEFTWEDWIKLDTGAWVAQRHKTLGILLVSETDIKAGANLKEIEHGADPFAAIAAPKPANNP
jgi:hypothetical protein